MARHESSMLALGWAPFLGYESGLVSDEVLGRYPVRVQAQLVDPTRAFDETLRLAGYEDPCDYIGSYMYRTIGGKGRVWSTHAYGTAIDHDYGGDTDGDGDPTIDKNPHIHRPILPGDPGFGVEWQILEHQVRAVEAIRNTYGEQVWRWLGWSIGDTMHWQTMVRPERTEVDWTTVKGDGDMSYEAFRADEFDLWSNENIVAAYDAGMFQDPNRDGFIQYWVTDRANRTAAEKARFITDYYAHLWK